jgi:integrase
MDLTLREVWRGIIRTEGVRPKRQAKALAVVDLRRMSRGTKSAPELAGARDKALLLVGFAGGFRRAELVGLDVADLREDIHGLVLTIRRSKTDQTGKGREVGIPYGSDSVSCPVLALRGWLEAAGITSGPIFRAVRKGGSVSADRLTDRAVSDLIKHAASRAHVSPTGLSGHSLRAGLVTAASKAGKSLRSIQDQTGHKSAEMVARYIRSASLFEDNAATGVL